MVESVYRGLGFFKGKLSAISIHAKRKENVYGRNLICILKVVRTGVASLMDFYETIKKLRIMQKIISAL